MGLQFPNSSNRRLQDGLNPDPTPIRSGDEVWEPVVNPVLEALQAELDRTVRGGAVFAAVVRAWRSGEKLGSNTELGEELGWEKGEVAEGFRLVRERVKAWPDPVLSLRVKEYTRELEMTPRAGVRGSGDLLLVVGGGRPEVAGRAMAGAAAAAKGRGLRLICEQPGDSEEQAQVLEAGGYAGYLILPVDETDDHGAVARVGSRGERVALLDIATRNGTAPCVSFDYAGAGLYCTQQLFELECEEVVVLTREHDSRTYAMAEGYRRAVRGAGRRAQRVATVDGSVVDTLCWLQERGLLGRAGRKLGLLCADGTLGEEVLRYLDGFEAGRWSLAVAVVGGARWGARHWAELIWADLDYSELAAAGAKFLLGTEGMKVPQVKPRYERWVPRKRAGNAGEGAEETWRPVIAC